MKKLLLLMLGLGCSFGIANAQQYVEEIYNSYFEQKYEVQLSKDSDERDLYFYAQVYADSTNYAFLQFKQSDVFVGTGLAHIEVLRKSLQSLRNKFVEWGEVARKNGVTDFSKKFDIQFPYASIMWYDEAINKYHTSERQEVSFTFQVFDDGTCAVHFIGTGTCVGHPEATETIYWVFSSTQEIDAFINFLAPANIESKLNQGNVSDLFQ